MTTRGGKVRPLIELRLFRSAGFTWGTTLATLVSFAMFGIFFVMPQYFQEVRGADALGSGVRLLPMVGGMVIGMVGGTRLASPGKGTDGTARTPRASAKLLVTIGFALMATAMALGAGTTPAAVPGTRRPGSRWRARPGAGDAAAMNVALGALSAERSGAGSALYTAMRQVGATIGVASSARCSARLRQRRGARRAARGAGRRLCESGVGAGAAVARQLGSAALLDEVRPAFVHGMDRCCGPAAASRSPARCWRCIFLPRRAAGGPGQRARPRREASPVAVKAIRERAQLAA